MSCERIGQEIDSIKEEIENLQQKLQAKRLEMMQALEINTTEVEKEINSTLNDIPEKDEFIIRLLQQEPMTPSIIKEKIIEVYGGGRNLMGLNKKLLKLAYSQSGKLHLRKKYK